MIVIPESGTVKVYAVPTVSSSGSSGANYIVVKILRSGQDEAGLSYDSRNGEITAYVPIFLGTLAVGPGDVISLQVTSTGTPSVALFPDDFALRCDLIPRS